MRCVAFVQSTFVCAIFDVLYALDQSITASLDRVHRDNYKRVYERAYIYSIFIYLLYHSVSLH